MQNILREVVHKRENFGTVFPAIAGLHKRERRTLSFPLWEGIMTSSCSWEFYARVLHRNFKAKIDSNKFFAATYNESVSLLYRFLLDGAAHVPKETNTLELNFSERIENLETSIREH